VTRGLSAWGLALLLLSLSMGVAAAPDRAGLIFTPTDWPQVLAGDFYRPHTADTAPVVLLVHGGGWHSGARQHMDHFAEALRAHGYAAFSIDYRLVPARHPAQLDDVRMALAWLRAESAQLNIDPQRIAIWGYSAGAHLAALAGYGATSAGVRALVLGGVPADLLALADSSMVQALMGGTVSALGEARYRAASPLYQIHAGAPPTFMFHARWDQVVVPEQVLALQAALDAAAVPNELHWLEWRGHVLGFYFNAGAVNAALRFLDRWLRAPPVASTDR